MSETTVTEARAAAVKHGGFKDAQFRRVTWSASVIVIAIFGGVLVSLGAGAMPAIKAFGLPFIYTDAWNPVTEKFGAQAPIFGTLVTSFLAMLMAVPVGIGIAIFLTEICPRALRRPIGIIHRQRRVFTPTAAKFVELLQQVQNQQSEGN